LEFRVGSTEAGQGVGLDYTAAMEQSPLYAPWRMDYIRSLESSKQPESPSGCFLCDAAATLDDAGQRRRRLVLWSTPLTLVMLNRFPYTGGHLLVAPREHHAELDALPQDVLCDLSRQTADAVAVLRQLLNPQGFNVGMNLGRAAGAGLPGHLHQHIVPRWAGDTNFVSVVGDVRIIPLRLDELWEKLHRDPRSAT
jgi:ATP adenylyltransferase